MQKLIGICVTKLLWPIEGQKPHRFYKKKYSFVFWRLTKVTQVWKNLRVTKHWQNFWVISLTKMKEQMNTTWFWFTYKWTSCGNDFLILCMSCVAHTNLLKNSMKPALLVELVTMSVWATSISLATQTQHAGVFWYIGLLIISLPWILPQI